MARRKNLRHRAERDYTKLPAKKGQSELWLPTAWLKKGGGKKKNPSVTMSLRSLKRLLTGAQKKKRTVVKARVR
jgi:hypothetical protein